MNKQSISVIIVLYNSQHLLDKIIENVNCKVPDAGEIILVENSKTQLIVNVSGSIPINIIYPDSNLGYAKAINLAYKNARFPLLLILNPDLEITEFTIDNYSSESLFLNSGLNVNIPKGHEFPRLFNDTLRITISRLYRMNFLKNIFDVRHVDIIQQIQNVDWFTGAMIFTNKKTMETLNGFDEEFFLFYEETDLCMKAAENSIPVLVDCNIKYAHTILDSSSDIDVSELRLKSELHSFFHYHSKYHKKPWVLFSRGFIFSFALLVFPLLSFLSVLSNNMFINKRAKLFKTYLNYFLAK